MLLKHFISLKYQPEQYREHGNVWSMGQREIQKDMRGKNSWIFVEWPSRGTYDSLIIFVF